MCHIIVSIVFFISCYFGYLTVCVFYKHDIVHDEGRVIGLPVVCHATICVFVCGGEHAGVCALGGWICLQLAFVALRLSAGNMNQLPQQRGCGVTRADWVGLQ